MFKRTEDFEDKEKPIKVGWCPEGMVSGTTNGCYTFLGCAMGWMYQRVERAVDTYF